MATQPQPQPTQTTFVSQAYVINQHHPPGLDKYAKVFYHLGITQIILSIISVIFGITLISYSSTAGYYYDVFSDFGTGIWCGAFFFVSGLLGVLTAKQKNICLVQAALVMAIFSSLAACTLFGLEITGAITTGGYYSYSQYYNVVCALHSVLVFVATVEFVVSIIHASYCCNTYTCCHSEAQNHVAYAYVNPANPTQILSTQLPGHQSAYLQNFPVQPGMNLQYGQQPVIITTAMPQQTMGFPAQVPQPYPQVIGSQQSPPAYQAPQKS